MLVTGAAGLTVWCRMMTGGYAGVRIENMTESWRDGLAFCAIIHRFRPSIIDYHLLQPGQVIRNCELAFSIAEKKLGIPSLLDPQDMLESSQLDKLSILTYVSQFYHKFSKEWPTPAVRRSITRERSDENFGQTKKDDENNNTCTDDQDQGEIEDIPHYSSTFGDVDFSSSSPYSSSSSSGCYQIPTASDSQNVEKSSSSKIKDSSPSSIQLSSQSPQMTGGGDTTSAKWLHKSSKSTNISESSTMQRNARKQNSDQTSTDFPGRPASRISVLNYKQLPAISPTPSSSSSKTSVTNELIFCTNKANDSGLDQSSVMSLTSSPSSSRLSSVSPSLDKMDRNIFTKRKIAQNEQMPSQEYPKEKNIVINDFIKTRSEMTSIKDDTTELITDRCTTFKETLTKFNSLIPVSGGCKTARLVSQGSQTDNWSPMVASQQCQTEESHLSCGDKARMRTEVKNNNRLNNTRHVYKVNYAANHRQEIGGGVSCRNNNNNNNNNNHKNRTRRQHNSPGVPSTNILYASVYRTNNYCWSSQGVQSTLV